MLQRYTAESVRAIHQMALYTVATGIHTLESSNENCGAIPVAVRLVFLRVGDIDTQKESFQAHVVIEARWYLHLTNDENHVLSSLSLDEQTELNDGTIIKLSRDYSEKYWHPKLFILNIGRNGQEQISYSMRQIASRIEICEFHDLHGSFYSIFDLHHFPYDIQELSISIGSALFDTDVVFEVDIHRTSGISREAFHDQQEWTLYRHVDARVQFVKGFFFQNDDEFDTPGHGRRRSTITVACHAARYASYSFWNGSCLLPLITLISFSSFAIPPHAAESRIHIVCTLLLSSLVFRWTISRSSPNTSYLTTMDRYAVVSIVVFLILCLWHAIIGSVIFIGNHHDALGPRSRWTWLDRGVFFVLLGSFVIIHLVMGIWHWRVPLAKRQHMKMLDDRYRQAVERNRSHHMSLYSTSKDVDFLV